MGDKGTLTGIAAIDRWMERWVSEDELDLERLLQNLAWVVGGLLTFSVLVFEEQLQNRPWKLSEPGLWFCALVLGVYVAFHMLSMVIAKRSRTRAVTQRKHLERRLEEMESLLIEERADKAALREERTLALRESRSTIRLGEFKSLSEGLAVITQLGVLLSSEPTREPVELVGRSGELLRAVEILVEAALEARSEDISINLMAVWSAPQEQALLEQLRSTMNRSYTNPYNRAGSEGVINRPVTQAPPLGCRRLLEGVG